MLTACMTVHSLGEMSGSGRAVQGGGLINHWGDGSDRYFKWKQAQWSSLKSEWEKSDTLPSADVQCGLQAYPNHQANVYDTLVHLFIHCWRRTLLSHGHHPTWLSHYPATSTPLQQHQDHSQLEPESGHRAHNHPPPIQLSHNKDTDTPLLKDVETGNDDDYNYNYNDNDNNNKYIISDTDLSDVEDEFVDWGLFFLLLLLAPTIAYLPEMFSCVATSSGGRINVFCVPPLFEPMGWVT